MEQLPLSQKPVYLVWYSIGGGLGVTARTDERGQPYIGHYPLDKNGLPKGRPSEYPRARLTTGIVAGYYEGRTIAVFADIEVTPKGLSLRINLPPSMSPEPRYLWTKWGSKSPPTWVSLEPIVGWLEDIRAPYSLV